MVFIALILLAVAVAVAVALLSNLITFIAALTLFILFVYLINH